jgi:lactoylglutathione lyase
MTASPTITTAQEARPVQIDGLFETHLTVSNLARAIAFYRDVLGLPLAHTAPERRVAFFWLGAPGRAMLGLWEASDVLRLHLHFAMAVSLDELLAAPARLRQFGVTPRGFHGEPSDEPVVLTWMPAAAVYFTDPDGHNLEYLTMLPNRPRPDLPGMPWSEWQTHQD